MTLRPQKNPSLERVRQRVEKTRPKLVLRLYVAGSSPNSAAALASLRALGASLPSGRFELEIVDVLRTPDRALSDAVLVTPTLVKVSPLPSCRIVGNLSQTELVLRSLGIAPGAAP